MVEQWEKLFWSQDALKHLKSALNILSEKLFNITLLEKPTNIPYESVIFLYQIIIWSQIEYNPLRWFQRWIGSFLAWWILSIEDTFVKVEITVKVIKIH